MVKTKSFEVLIDNPKHNNKIFRGLIFMFLQSSFDNQLYPTLESFKLAMLNKKFQKLILSIFKNVKLKDFGKYDELEDSLQIFDSSPPFDRFLDLEAKRTMQMKNE